MTRSVPLEVAPSAFSGLIGVGAPRHDPAGGDLRPHVGRRHPRLRGRASTGRSRRPRSRCRRGRRRRGRGCSSRWTSRCSAISAAPRTPSACSRRSARRSGSSRGELLVNCSHTHSAPWAAMSRSHMPGGELIGPYLDQLERGDPGGRAGGDRRARPRDADLGDGPLRPRAQPRPPRPGERRRQASCAASTPTAKRRRHARRRPRHGGRRRRVCSGRSSTTPATRPRSPGTTR